MSKKKVYISSKMTGLPDFNFPAFYKKAKELEAMGFEVLNPTEIGDKYGTDKPISFYRRKNIEMLLQADILFIFGDVENSKGVEFEKLIARELDLPIWREENEAKNVSYQEILYRRRAQVGASGGRNAVSGEKPRKNKGS